MSVTTRKRHRGAFLLLMMLCQQLALLLGGYSLVRFGLPLHLCSFSACLLLYALCFPRARLARTAADFVCELGLPGAMLAITFPAVAETPCPWLTTASFYGMHAALLVFGAALWKEPQGARWTSPLLFTALVALCLFINKAFSANYLFLAQQPPVLAQVLSALPLPAPCVYLLASAAVSAVLRASRCYKKHRPKHKLQQNQTVTKVDRKGAQTYNRR